MMCSNSHFAVVFINGLGNTYEDAYHSGEDLAASLGVGVNIDFNPGTDDAPLAAAAIGLGTLASILTLNPIPFLASTMALPVIDCRKGVTAQHVAGRMAEFLGKHSFNHILVVAHSQGCDIVSKAFKYLNKDKRCRISCFAFGGKIIAEGLVARVHNVEQKGDIVPQFITTRDQMLWKFSDRERYVTIISGTSHSFASYVSHSVVLRKLQNEIMFLAEKIQECHRPTL